MLGGKISTITALALLLIPIAAVRAQQLVQLQEATTSASDILVTGRRPPTDQEVARHATQISRMADFHREPLARFDDPVCPGIIGLPADVAGIIVDRMRHDVERVGAKLDRSDKCRANIIVIFVRDGASEVRSLSQAKDHVFAGLEQFEIKEIEKTSGPVRAWSTTTLRTRHGTAETGSLEQGAVGIQGQDILLGTAKVITTPSSDSRIFLPHRIDIDTSVIVIDVAAIDGMSAVQIADYAAMRGLARTRPRAGAAAVTSVLSLFDPAATHPYEMTGFDLAYLRSLYDGGGNLPAAAKILGIARQLRKDQGLASNTGVQK